MPADPIVGYLDIFEDISFGQITGFVDPFLDMLLLHAAEEKFRYGIVPTVTPSTHAGFQVDGFGKA